MKTGKIFWGAIALTIGMIACKKNDDNPRKDSLVGSWLSISAGIDQNGNGSLEQNEVLTVDTPSMSVYKFASNATMSISNYINPAAGSFNGTWDLENNGADIKIIETGTGITSLYHIVSLAEHDMTLSVKDGGNSNQIDFVVLKK